MSGAQATPAPQPDEPAPAPGAPLAPRDDADGLTAAQRKAVQNAQAQAAAAGKPVTVDALTTQTSTTTVNPSGTTTYDSSLLPVRVRKNGAWTPVDATLVHNADGTYSPAAATGALALSGGGTAPLAAMGAGTEQLAFDWPTALPAPTAAGDTLTYPDVLPDIDLKVTATTLGGFSEVLVVKSASAAADPALGSLVLATRATGVTVKDAGPEGLAAVTPGGDVAYSAPAPLMWDSAKAAGVAGARTVSPAVRARSAVLPSAASPQPGAHTAPLRVDVSAGKLTLTPDRKLLTGKDTVYPVYIDPSWNPHPTSGARQHWNEVQEGCPTTSNFDSTKYGDPGVGDNTYSGCVGKERAYYQLAVPSVIWGAHVVSAVINTTETYAAQCDTTSTVDMYQTSAVSKAFTWNTKPAAGAKIGSKSFAPACSSYVSGGFAATSTLVKAAAGHWSSLAFVLINANETNGYHFKRFAANPSVSITYNRVPNAPSTPTVKVTGSTYGCATATPYPVLGKTVATTPPSLSALVSDPDKDALQATYTYWVGTGAKATLKSKDVSSGQQAPASFPLAYIKGLADGTVVNWQVSVSDGEDSKANTSTCHFTVDQRAPVEPTMTADVYPDIDADGAPGAPAGTPGAFTAKVDPGTSQNNAAKFVFGLDSPPPTSGAPASQTKTATNNTATYTATPVAPGTHTLFAYALDSAGNESPMHEYHFTAVGHVGKTYPSLSAAFDNTAVSDDTARTAANADGSGYSLSKQDFLAQGWRPGGKVTVDGATFTLPDFGSGAPDNVLAANQTITMSGQKGGALVFLATSTFGGSSADRVPADHSSPYVPDGTDISAANCTYGYDNTRYSDCSEASGTITYTDGTAPQSYYLAVPDWSGTGLSSLSVVNLPHVNHSTGQDAQTHHVYAFAVPIAAGKQLSSVTLPDLSDTAQTQVPGLHIFAMAVRDTATAPNGTSWTGAWSAPTDSPYRFNATGFSDQSFRVSAPATVSGNSLRIRLSNSQGRAPLSVDDVTVGHAGATYASTDGTPTRLTFGGDSAVTIPVGGELYSDPLEFPVTGGSRVIVSFHLASAVDYLVMHTKESISWTSITAPGSGDHAGDPSDTFFMAAGSTAEYVSAVLTGIDVTTDTGRPTIAVLGDGLRNKPGSIIAQRAPHVSDDLAAAFRADSQGLGPAGVDEVGIANNLMTQDQGAGGRSVLSRLDRDVLSIPDITSVVVYEGGNDILGGADDAALTNAYGILRDQLNAWGIRVVFLNLTPCGGDPLCTETVEDNRVTVNEWISDQNAAIPPGVAAVDANGAVAVDDPTSTTTPPLQILSAATAPADFDTGDHVNLTADGYAAVAGTLTADLSVLLPPAV